jgi:glycosyltransferase involved in cell wall biosynthesis
MPTQLGVLVRRNEPYSMMVYREEIVTRMPEARMQAIIFNEYAPVPDTCDLIWDPSLGGNTPPMKRFRSVKTPFVATVHGASPFSMRWKDIFPSARIAFIEKTRNLMTLRRWRWFRPMLKAVIAVSDFGKDEICRMLMIRNSSVHVIYHGLNRDIFTPSGEAKDMGIPYFLVVAQYQKKKNIERILSAYQRLPQEGRPRLVAILPGYEKTPAIKGLLIIQEGLSQKDLAPWYRGAAALVFPSLHETFGMPIIEAMACGCPVITSDRTACRETAGDAALLVDPYSIGSISHAMRTIIDNRGLRSALISDGLHRARAFSWQKSAESHLRVFEQALGKHEN